MKNALRLLALLTALCLLTVSFSSCLAYIRIMEILSEETEEDTGDDNNGEVKKDNPYLQFTLTEDDEVSFYELLEKCEELTLLGTDVSAIERAWEALEAQYYHIGTQVNIARILYDCDLKSDQRSEDYLFASEMVGTVYQSYMELCQTIDKSASPYRDTFFSDWTDAEINEMRSYTEQITELKLANDEIMMEARELDPEKQAAEYYELYRRFVENNNQIAQALGHSNYYVYASRDIYMRDFGPSERNNLRAYVKEYLVPLCKTAWDQFVTSMEKLSYRNQLRVESFFEDDYDDLSEDYITPYLEQLGGSTQREMKSLFDANNAIFTDSSRAYDGAYTAYLYEHERPICYFGPSYQDIWTVVHEMGHFYAAQYTQYEMIPLDIAEIHSQGNEMLFLAQLQDELGEKYKPIAYYQIYSMLANVIVSTAIDEFEEKVYTQGASQLDFEELMNTVEAQYGGEGFVEEYITDMELYWKYVAIESPVYYISYATSGIVSLSLFVDAQTDFDAACLSYRKLSEETDPMAGFVQTLTMAELSSPFQRTTYESMRDLLPE